MAAISPSGYIGYNKESLKLIQQIPVLSALNEESLKIVLKHARFITYKADEVIMDEGEYGSDIFFLLKGTVTIIKNDKEVALLNKTGDFFGEMAIIENLPRSAKVAAKDDCSLISLEASVLDSLDANFMMAAIKHLFKTFSEKLSQRLRVVSKENTLLKNEIAGLEKENKQMQKKIEELEKLV